MYIGLVGLFTADLGKDLEKPELGLCKVRWIDDTLRLEVKVTLGSVDLRSEPFDTKLGHKDCS